MVLNVFRISILLDRPKKFTGDSRVQWEEMYRQTSPCLSASEMVRLPLYTFNSSPINNVTLLQDEYEANMASNILLWK